MKTKKVKPIKVVRVPQVVFNQMVAACRIVEAALTHSEVIRTDEVRDMLRHIARVVVDAAKYTKITRERGKR